MFTTSHTPMRGKSFIIEVAAGKYRTVRYDRPARTNDRRRHIAEQLAGAR